MFLEEYVEKCRGMCGRVGEVEGEMKRREGYGKECWRVLRKCEEEVRTLVFWWEGGETNFCYISLHNRKSLVF